MWVGRAIRIIEGGFIRQITYIDINKQEVQVYVKTLAKSKDAHLPA